MLSSDLFNAATVLYFVSMLLFFVFLASRGKTVGLSGSIAAWCGFLVQTAAIGLRWKESYDLGHGHAPLTNLYESVVFFAWTIILIFVLIDLKYKYRVIGAFVLPFAVFAMAWAQLGLKMRSGIEPLLPALQSNWLLYHVVTCFLGYAAFAVACGVSIMYLIKSKCEVGNGKAKAGGIIALFPPTRVLDELNYKAIMVGFPLLTLGIITGAAWADYAWGSYWSWDPKETWSLIVWFIYAAFLHARITRGWVGKRAAVLSVIGFVATIFCYLGVNLLLSGLHSYGGA
jgi:cytochrome c-type biogenesis protein CcsB